MLRNLHQLFDWQCIGQIIDGDFATFCGLLRVYEPSRRRTLTVDLQNLIITFKRKKRSKVFLD